MNWYSWTFLPACLCISPEHFKPWTLGFIQAGLGSDGKVFVRHFPVGNTDVLCLACQKIGLTIAVRQPSWI